MRTEREPAIDMWAPIFPTREMVAHMQKEFPEEQLQYFEIFTKRKISPAEFRTYAETLARDDDAIVADLDRGAIERAMMTGFDERSTCGSTFVPNEIVAAFHERHPDRVLPYAGADIMRGNEALKELEHWVGDRGFRGLSLRPFMIGRPADDRAYYPFYAKCVELGIPVSLHMSANWTRTRPSSLGHPQAVDNVACHFPDLTIVMSHGGYPWVLEACLIAWKHPNVYLELGAHRPKYLAAPGAGWEPLMRFGQTTIQDKIIYGTGAFLIGRRASDLVDEFRALPVAEDVMRKWLRGNAARLHKLD